MKYEEFIKKQDKLNKTQVIWSQVVENPDKFKNSVESKSKVIFYEDLYNQLSTESKQEMDSPENFKENLKMYFKCENISYNFIKSYSDFVLKKFENGYLWNKITADFKFDNCYNEVEFIDKDIEHKSIAINSVKMFNSLNKAYPKYIKTKKDMKNILKTYFTKNNIEHKFISDEEEYSNYSKTVVDRLYKKN